MTYSQLLENVTHIPGVSDKTATHLHRLNLKRVIDILLFLPHRLMEVKVNPKSTSIYDGDTVMLKVSLIEVDHKPKFTKRSNFKIVCQYQGLLINLVFFNYYPSYIIPKLSQGEQFHVFGKIQKKFGQININHPKFIFSNETGINRYMPIYHLTYGLVNEQIHKWANFALTNLKSDYDLLPKDILTKQNFPSLYEAFDNIHNSKNANVILPNSPYVERIAFDELVAHQLAVNLLKNNNVKNNGISFINDGELLSEAIRALPFDLTKNQLEVIKEIHQDQKSPKQMMRLVQGDVGSGKTAVALVAAVNALASGKFQIAIMAPLDILANQHYIFFKKTLDHLGIKIVLLTGKIKGRARSKITEEISNGEVSIIIGTHALFQEKTHFNNLGLIIIDEQHRFGVNQRMSLLDKGCNSDMLMLTATPIPRTLTQIIYADLDVSIISEKPPGRIPIKTTITSDTHIDQVIESLKRAVSRGAKIYWLCQIIEEGDENEDVEYYRPMNIEQRYKTLSDIFPEITGFIHGKLSADEKEAVLNKFHKGDLKILVATTVIEVGIDVKDATIIIIENAEGYGLAQLHQLRGRVGRGDKESFCILLYSKRCSKDALARLTVLKNTEDGFKIADEDLKMRGGGSLVGTKQSGLPDFKVCNLYFHSHLAAKANNLAQSILSEVGYDYESLAENYKILMDMYNYSANSLKVT